MYILLFVDLESIFYYIVHQSDKRMGTDIKSNVLFTQLVGI